jgi:hypothetical protein
MFSSIVVACSGASERKNDGEPAAGTDAGAGRTTGGASGRGGSAGRDGHSGGKAGGLAVGSGGFGNVGAEGGEAGVTGVGGTVPIAGSVGVGGISGNTGSAGSPNGSVPPAGWNCGAQLYGDGSCDCGCGVQDRDCERSDDLDECVTCNRFGSCNNYACPGRIDPEDTTTCSLPPAAWTCVDYYYADTVFCDCGCGAMDPDCEDDDIASCDTCGLSGGCGGGTCPASINPEDITTCITPEGWTCGSIAYNDGYNCDCGCGVVDLDCEGPERSYCQDCAAPGSCSEYDGFCSDHIDEFNNAVCSGPPANWTCAARLYGDGVLCHCGCGAIDSDCEGRECEVCNARGACSSQPCPGMINPNDEANCVQPEVPAGWTCDYFAYGDGQTCDCGCGVQDFDCLTADIGACESCYSCGGSECPGNLDPADPTRCLPPPAGWRCGPEYYSDGFNCDCGCGVPDPDCAGTTPNYCSSCPEGSCANFNCQNLLPNDNAHCLNEPPPAWTCEFEVYGDGLCDCGCGAVDLDCASPSRSSCQFCKLEGSCSSTECPGTINLDNNAVCGG